MLLVEGRMVASRSLVWVQSEFETLTGIFDRVGLRTNIHKIVGIVCRSFREVKVRTDKAYTRWMIGEGNIRK